MTATAEHSTHDVTLFGHWSCPYVTRVQFALHQRRIPYSLVNVPPTAARPRDFVVPEEFVVHSPKGEIPLLRIDGQYLADSIPILAWMEATIDDYALVPSDVRHAQLMWDRIGWIDTHLFPAMIGVYYGFEDQAIADASARVGACLDELEHWLEEGPFLAGASPTLADAVAVSFFVRRSELVTLGLELRLTPTIAAYEERMLATEGGRAVAWGPEQSVTFVANFERFRAKMRARSSAPPSLS